MPPAPKAARISKESTLGQSPATASASASKSTAGLPESFDRAQAKKAVDALLVYQKKRMAEKEKEELIPREEHVWLVVNLKTGSTRRALKPVRIQLPHPPLPPPPATSVCLVSKDPQRTYKDLLAAHDIKFVSRVVGVDKLKGKFKPFEARRELLREHELFLCDEAVVPLMPQLLGKMFFEAKKQPIPVNLKRKDLKAELARAISSTYFHPSTGTSLAVRIATPPTTTPQQTLDNVLAATPLVLAQVAGGLDNVLSVGVKMSESVLLPIWSSKLEGRFVQPAAPAKGKSAKADKADVEMSSEDEDEAEPAPAVVPKPTPTPKKVLAPAKKAAGKTDKLAAKKDGKKVSSPSKKSAKSAILGSR